MENLPFLSQIWLHYWWLVRATFVVDRLFLCDFFWQVEGTVHIHVNSCTGDINMWELLMCGEGINVWELLYSCVGKMCAKNVGVTYMWRGYSHVGVTHVCGGALMCGSYFTHVWGKCVTCVGVTHMWRGHSHVGDTHMWREHSCVGVTQVWRDIHVWSYSHVEGTFTCNSYSHVKGTFMCGSY